MASGPDSIPQVAALPVRTGQVCLITSKNGKRWVIPKGGMQAGKTAGQMALQEAWEEAGLVGLLHREPVGSYLYKKWGKLHHVTVFLMQVTRLAPEWPECTQRQRCWLPPAKAIALIDDPGLCEIIQAALAFNPWQNAATDDWPSAASSPR